MRRSFGSSPTVLDADEQKTPLGQSLSRFAEAKARDAVNVQALSLPCNVSAVVSPGVVTVAFAVNGGKASLPAHTIPVLRAPGDAYPIKVGDAGLAVAASVRLGQLSGLGGGTPNLWEQPGNLTPLAFIWLGNKATTTIDPNAWVLMGNISIGGPPFSSTLELGFFGKPKITKRSLTGALSSVTDPAAKAVLQSIVTALCDSGYGLTTDSTS